MNVMVEAKHKARTGFTIVELLITIVVIAILAAISIVVYNGIQQRARVSEAKSHLTQAKRQLEIYRVDNDRYPTTDNLAAAGVKDGDVTYQYTSTDGLAYCLTGVTGSIAYNTSSADTGLAEGVCSGHTLPEGDGITNGALMQTITANNCPDNRTVAVDARDNRTYWVQKLADGRCWMLTNLAYGGGGTNTYGDTVTLTNGGAKDPTFIAPDYYVPPGANPTTNPNEPSVSTSGTGQYGYLYSFCAANGGQTGNAACSASLSTPIAANISACPKNWRLPTGGSGGEFTALNNAINSGSTSSDIGLRSGWLVQRSGIWYRAFDSQGSDGWYWSSTPASGFGTSAYYLGSRSANISLSSRNQKDIGMAIRCVAN